MACLQGLGGKAADIQQCFLRVSDQDDVLRKTQHVEEFDRLIIYV